ncbi:MAG: hypothetical protein R2710_28300 [Acidimicrobiales bacterium]
MTQVRVPSGSNRQIISGRRSSIGEGVIVPRRFAASGRNEGGRWGALSRCSNRRKKLIGGSFVVGRSIMDRRAGHCEFSRWRIGGRW